MQERTVDHVRHPHGTGARRNAARAATCPDCRCNAVRLGVDTDTRSSKGAVIQTPFSPVTTMVLRDRWQLDRRDDVAGLRGLASRACVDPVTDHQTIPKPTAASASGRRGRLANERGSRLGSVVLRRMRSSPPSVLKRLTSGMPHDQRTPSPAAIAQETRLEPALPLAGDGIEAADRAGERLGPIADDVDLAAERRHIREARRPRRSGGGHRTSPSRLSTPSRKSPSQTRPELAVITPGCAETR